MDRSFIFFEDTEMDIGDAGDSENLDTALSSDDTSQENIDYDTECGDVEFNNEDSSYDQPSSDERFGDFDDDTSSVDYDKECGDVDYDEECGDIDYDNECDDSSNAFVDEFDVEKALRKIKKKSPKKETKHEIEYDEECGDACTTTDFKSESSKKKTIDFDTECGDVDYNEECGDDCIDEHTESSYTKIDGLKEHSDLGFEFAVLQWNAIGEDQLRTERQVLGELTDVLYKECMLEQYVDLDEIDDEEDEFVQERYLGGTGRKVRNIAKPLVSVGKSLHDRKYNIHRFGLIRNTFSRTGDDLKARNPIYVILMGPLYILKNLFQTIGYKTRSYSAYRSILSALEVKLNREITHIKKNVANSPKEAQASSIGFVATTAANAAKGETVSLNPIDFLKHEGSRLIENIGNDNLLHGLTYKLANALENQELDIPNMLTEINAKKSKKIPTDANTQGKNILYMKDGNMVMDGVVSMKGIDQFLMDIDKWSEITNAVVEDVKEGKDKSISSYRKEMNKIEDRYVKDGKLRSDMIFRAKSNAVKITDFYEELASKLTDKANGMKESLTKLSELDTALKEGTIELDSDIKKEMTELNQSIQHTANAFVEIMEALDELGKYVKNTMNTYLSTLQDASKDMTSRGKADPSAHVEKDDGKKKHHKLFRRKMKTEEEDEIDA
jgi:hypothetical protein